jgi:hypothetical protein
MSNQPISPEKVTSQAQPPTSRQQRMLQHITFLSQNIGGRGSCTEQEEQACQYAARMMQAQGLESISIDNFQANPSTYRPFALAFGAALLGSLAALLFPGSISFAIAAFLNGLGAIGMLAETNLTSNWMQWLLRKTSDRNVSDPEAGRNNSDGEFTDGSNISGNPTNGKHAVGHNAVGRYYPKKSIHNQIVLCAHIDTHRTPIFYSSKKWQQAFSLLVLLAFASMAIGALLFILTLLTSWRWLLWGSPFLSLIQLSALILCLHADFTPYSPGANDNASGAAVCLEIANHLPNEPLDHTSIYFAFTGCEEVGAHGIKAFLNQYAHSLDKNTIFIILDEVGQGFIKYLTQDGLVFQHPTHPQALALARQTASMLEGLDIREGPGLAYTDALVATQRGHIALTVCTLPEADGEDESHWHQMSDTLEHIDPDTLEHVFQFAWTLIQSVEKGAFPSQTA